MSSMYKKLSVLILIVASSVCFAFEFEEEVSIRNYSCQFINEGMWFAGYTADGIMLHDPIEDLKIKVRVHDAETKKVVHEGTLVFKNVASSTAGRYADAGLEGEDVCQSKGGFLEVISASAIRDDKRINIKISSGDFEPTPIVVKS